MLAWGGFKILFSTMQHFVGSDGNGGSDPGFQEVLQLIVNGRSNKEIATMLGVSANTVAVHRANIMQAMGIHNTAELVVCAIRQGLVSIS